MQTTNSVLSLLNQLNNMREAFVSEISQFEAYAEAIKKLEEENKTLKDKCETLEIQSNEYKEETESLRRVSIIKNMSKQVHDLKSQNEILMRKVNHYKSIADIKTDSSILSASNFDGKEDIDDNIEEDEIDVESIGEEYNITDSLARLLNIPIETEMTSKAAVSRVLEYIDDNNIFDSKKHILKNDYKLYFFLNLNNQLTREDSAIILKNLCKLVKQYGLITNDNISKSTSIKSDSSNKKTIEDYLNNSDDNKSNSYVSTILLAQSSDPHATIDTASEEEDEEEELEIKKIGKRYYYVSIGTNIVYKAVKLKTGDYDIGKRLGTYNGDKIIKD